VKVKWLKAQQGRQGKLQKLTAKVRRKQVKVVKVMEGLERQSKTPVMMMETLNSKAENLLNTTCNDTILASYFSSLLANPYSEY
jgi:hypothetical protein